jgi:hypothetical protein
MRCDNVVIEELVLRVPGVRPDDAPRLVEEVLRRVQENLRGSGRTGHFRLTELRVRIPTGVSRDELIARIADELTESLR